MKSKCRYRKWVDDAGDEHFLMIHPSDLMIQISFSKDKYLGDKVCVYQSALTNPLATEIFSKHKCTAFKFEWEAAVRKATQYIKGEMLHLSLVKAKLS